MPPPNERLDGISEKLPLSPEQAQLEINTLLAITTAMDAYTADRIRRRLLELRFRYGGRGQDEMQEYLIQTALGTVNTRLINEFERRHSAQYFPWSYPTGTLLTSEKKWSIQLPEDDSRERIANLHNLWLSDKPLRAKIGVVNGQVTLESGDQYVSGYTGFTLCTFPYATTQVIGIERTFEKAQLVPTQNRFLLEAEPDKQVRVRLRNKQVDFTLGFGIARKQDANNCGEADFLHTTIYQPLTSNEEFWPKLD